MRRLAISMIALTLLFAFPSMTSAQEQQSGTELKFENIDEIKNRPSDIHIGSDPEYRPGMENQYGGSDTGGYQKQQVDPDKTFIQEKTYYKRVDEKDTKGSPPPSRWD